MMINLVSCMHVVVKSRKPFFSAGVDKGWLSPFFPYSLMPSKASFFFNMKKARQTGSRQQTFGWGSVSQSAPCLVVDFLVLRSFARHLLNTSLPLHEMILSQMYAYGFRDCVCLCHYVSM